jgi:hypothetical protein
MAGAMDQAPRFEPSSRPSTGWVWLVLRKRGAGEPPVTYFDSRSPSTRRMSLAYVTRVKRPDLRAGRVARVVTVCAAGEPLSRVWRRRD